MNRAIEDALIELLIKQLATRATAADMVDWTTEAHVAGEDTPALVTLAGLDRGVSVFEAMPWFDKALSELNLAVLSHDEVRRAFVGAVSRGLLDGRITAEQALDRVHEHAVTPLGHPADLSAWCFVWERLGPNDFTNSHPPKWMLRLVALPPNVRAVQFCRPTLATFGTPMPNSHRS